MYAGKYIDTFEMALKTLLFHQGYGEISDLDVMGKRCFGFYNGEEENAYYISVADTETAVREIAVYMQLTSKFTVRRLTGLEITEICDESGIVCGPIGFEPAVQRPRNIFYNGRSRYIYIEKMGKDHYVLTDPDGFFLLSYAKADLKSLLGKESYSAITVSENNGMYEKRFCWQRIWEDGWEYHWKIVNSSIKSTEKERAFQDYKNISSKRIALWCGVLNCIQQMEKLWTFREKVKGRTKDSREFRRLQSSILKKAELGEVNSLPELECAMWKELL